MNHLRHAPETNVGQSSPDDPVPNDPIPAKFMYARVKQSDTVGVELGATVPCDLTAGITLQHRVFRLGGDPGDIAVDCQIAPNGKTLPPLLPDQAAPDPYRLKTSYIGTITVNVPNGEPLTFPVSTGSSDNVPVDLTNGIEVKYAFASVTSSPIGPLLNIDITPSGP